MSVRIDIKRKKLKEWIKKELLIEIPENFCRDSYCEGLVVGIEMERKRIQKLIGC